jgi:hypothetical protein
MMTPEQKQWLENQSKKTGMPLSELMRRAFEDFRRKQEKK